MPFYRPVRRWIALLMFSGLLTEECIALELRFPLTEVVRTHRSVFLFSAIVSSILELSINDDT